MNTSTFIQHLLERFEIEHAKRDRSGVYGFTQRLMAYNSNKIEGSTLTEEQTASLFDTGVLPKSDDYYRAKDVEEMNGHFLMFNKMLDTLNTDLSQDLIKQFHYELKSGVFEDRANGYAIGDYKKRPNMVGINKTALPSQVPEEMQNLLNWYSAQEISLETLAEFHARYEIIHPFQDGNGRTGLKKEQKYYLNQCESFSSPQKPTTKCVTRTLTTKSDSIIPAIIRIGQRNVKYDNLFSI